MSTSANGARLPHSPSAAAPLEDLEESTMRKVTLRLLPFLFLLYMLNILDRNNVGFAKLTMLNDLKMSERAYAIGAGACFYFGYFFFEVPSNLILRKTGARRWIGRIMITWGIISASMMFVTNDYGFYLLRVLLGIAEAGFFPGIILYVSYWFPARRRARAVANFMTASAITGIVGGPMSGAIMEYLKGVGGLTGWQWLFLLEGLPSVIVGFITLYYLTDYPRQAGWLTPHERGWLEERMSGEENLRHQHHGFTMMQTLRNPRVWHLCLLYFTVATGSTSYGLFAPTLIEQHFSAKVPPPESAPAQDPSRQADEQAIHKQSSAFVASFNRHDAKALANLWTEEGEYIDDHGTTHRSRAAIEEAMARSLTEHPKRKIEVRIDTIRFLSRNTVVQEGYAKAMEPKGHDEELPEEGDAKAAASRARVVASSKYSVLYVREGGKWLMAMAQEWQVESNKFLIGLLSAIPAMATVIAMVLMAKHSDRTGERRWHIAIPAFCAALGWVMVASLDSPYLVLVGLTLALAGMLTMLPTFWSLPTSFLSGAAAAGGIAFINSVGNLGGAVARWVVGEVKTQTGSYSGALYFLAGVLVLGGVLAILATHDRKLETTS